MLLPVYDARAFMSVDGAPATILCLPWKSWTLNSKRASVADLLTADQTARYQWRSSRRPRERSRGWTSSCIGRVIDESHKQDPLKYLEGIEI